VAKKKKKKSRGSFRGYPPGYKRVAIVGKGEGRGLAPRAGTPGVEVWGCNNVGLQQKVDMIWDMHNLDWTIEENRENYRHLAKRISPEEIEFRVKLRHEGFKNLKRFSNETGTAIMSIKQYADVRKSYAFPLEKILEKYAHPKGPGDLFTSVVPYMLAYAIFKKYTRIDVYGINCAYHEEWAYQREAVSAWANFARGQGIPVTFTGGQKRLGIIEEGYLYGYNIPQQPRGVKMEDKWMEAKDQIAAARGEIDPYDKDQMVERRFDVWKESQ
jgi:hypothetical protein